MVKILVGSRRPWLSDALATWSYDTSVFDQPLSIDTLVSAAVNVVLPWSTCPIVPTLQCGFFRSNFCFAIRISSSTCASAAPAASLRGDLVRDRLRCRIVVRELHGVGRTALRHRPQVGGVAEH